MNATAACTYSQRRRLRLAMISAWQSSSSLPWCGGAVRSCRGPAKKPVPVPRATTCREGAQQHHVLEVHREYTMDMSNDVTA
jgi:hypothetical protein